MRAPALLLVAGAALVAGCATSSGGASREAAPDPPRLRARVEALHAAWASDDDETAYGMFTPSMRAMVSLTDYRRERDDARREHPRPPGRVVIHSVTPCVCGSLSVPAGGKVLRCAVLVDGSFTGKDGNEERGRYLMAWEHIDGEWYYLLADEGDECPRPNP